MNGDGDDHGDYHGDGGNDDGEDNDNDNNTIGDDDDKAKATMMAAVA